MTKIKSSVFVFNNGQHLEFHILQMKIMTNQNV